MDKQKVFDTVARHLLTQKRKSVRVHDYGDGKSIEICVYRSADGAKCAIGSLIKDENFKPEYDLNGGVPGLLRFNPDVFSEYGVVGQPDIVFLVDLQLMHDQLPVVEWPKRLRALGEDHSLDLSVLNELSPKNT